MQITQISLDGRLNYQNNRSRSVYGWMVQGILWDVLKGKVSIRRGGDI